MRNLGKEAAVERAPASAAASSDESRQIHSIAFISGSAFSLVHFKGTLIRTLAKTGIEVSAYAPDFDSEGCAAIEALGASPLRFPLNRASVSPLVLLSEVSRLRKLLRRERPDAVLACFVKPVVVGILAAWLAGIRCRYSSIEGLGYYFTEFKKRSVARLILRWLIMHLLRITIRLSRKTFFFNSEDPCLLVGPNWRSARNIVYVRGGVGLDLSEFSSVALPDALTFIFVGRLLPEKGLHEYVAAARHVKAKYSWVRFLIVGGQDQKERSISLALVNSWQAEGIVEWTGPVRDVRPYIAQATVLVLPSYREGAPRSIQEAMAMGRPIITTDVAGCKDMVRSGRNGMLVPPGESRPLADAMLAFAADPGLATRMGRQSRLIACEDFDHVRIARFVRSHLLDCSTQ